MKFLALGFGFLFTTLAIGGQVRTTGQLSGVVVDPSGAFVPAATIRIEEPSTHFTQTATSGAAGEYVFAQLQPGKYRVTSNAPGFSQAVYTDVVIEAARTIDLKVEMKVGNSSQAIEVSAQSQILETSSNTLATTISPDAVQNLPLNGRDTLPLAGLTAGSQSGGTERFTTYNALPNGGNQHQC